METSESGDSGTITQYTGVKLSDVVGKECEPYESQSEEIVGEVNREQTPLEDSNPDWP